MKIRKFCIAFLPFSKKTLVFIMLPLKIIKDYYCIVHMCTRSGVRYRFSFVSIAYLGCGIWGMLGGRGDVGRVRVVGSDWLNSGSL